MIKIPKYFEYGLKAVPPNSSVGIIMRHAERYEIKRGKVGLEVPLTNDGRISAFNLGETFFKNKLNAIYSSYVQRCIDTGKEIKKGAEQDSLNIKEWKVLSGDDIFIRDFKTVSEYYMAFGMLTLLDKAYNRESVEGLNDVTYSVYKFLDEVLIRLGDKRGFNLFITHDMFISIIAGEIFRHRTTADNWPEFMEPIFVWKDNEYINLFFRNNLKEYQLPV